MARPKKIPIDGMKCTCCGLYQSLDNFPRDKHYASGYKARCKICLNKIRKERRYDYKYEHSPKGIANTIKYRSSDKGKLNKANYGKKWSAIPENREKMREYQLKANKTLLRKLSQKRYYETQNGRAKKREKDIRYKSKRRGSIINDFSNAQWLTQIKLQNGRCFYCKNKIDLTIDHIIPVSKGGEHTQSNIVAACKSCNSRKGNKIWLLL